MQIFHIMMDFVLKVFLARWVAWLFPQFQIEKIKPEWTSRDPDIVCISVLFVRLNTKTHTSQA